MLMRFCFRWVFLLPVVLSLTWPAQAVDVKEGAWDMDMVVLIRDGSEYKVLDRVKRRDCLSRADIERVTNPAIERKRLTSQFGTCSANPVNEATTASSSWSADCVSTDDGMHTKVLVTSTVATNELALFAEVKRTGTKGETYETQLQRTYTYAGACTRESAAR